MGVWGTGLYSNDVTADLKTAFRDIVRLPLGTDELVDRLTTIFAEAAQPDDEMYTCFWLVVADLLHIYGFDAPLIYSRALDIVSSGQDLELHRKLGLSDRDVQFRAKELQKLAARLREPNPKPRHRRLRKQPEPWVFSEGAFIVYPTREQQPVNPYIPKRFMADWVGNGWGAFVVLGRDRMYDFFAVYLIAVLPPLGASEPDVQTVGAPSSTICVPALVTVPSSHPRKMHLRELATCPVKQREIESHFVPGTPPFDSRPQVLGAALLEAVLTYPWSYQLDSQRFVDFSSTVM